MNPPIDAEARMRRTGLARRSVIAGLASLGLAGTSWARAAPKVMEKNLVVETADGSAEAALFYPVGKGRWPDRKSVVSGKSGAVRVDIGGRRNIKKKNKHNEE